MHNLIQKLDWTEIHLTSEIKVSLFKWKKIEITENITFLLSILTFIIYYIIYKFQDLIQIPNIKSIGIYYITSFCDVKYYYLTYR